MENNAKAVTVRDLLRTFFDHKIVFIIVPLMVMVPAYFGLRVNTPKYKASVKMFVKAEKDTEADYYKGIMYYRTATADHAELVKSHVVLRRVVEALDLDKLPIDRELKFAPPQRAAALARNIEQAKQQLQMADPEQKKLMDFDRAMKNLSDSISLKPLPDTRLFEISVTDFDPSFAVLMANSVSRSYIIYDLEQLVAELKLKYGEKNSTIMQIENHIKEFEKTLRGNLLNDIEAIGPASVKIVEQARTSEPLPPSPRMFLLIFSFISSIVLSIILVFVFEYVDNTFKSPQKIEKLLNLSVLGSVPRKKFKHKFLYNRNSNGSNYLKSDRNLSENIFMSLKEAGLKSLLITDIEGSKETALIIANIGMYLADNHKNKVLIIDANLRSPYISNVFGISNSPGLADVLDGKISFEDAIQVVNDTLFILPSGNTELNSVILLKSPMMSELLLKTRDWYDMVFISGAELLNFTDSVILSNYADGIAIVINEGKTKHMVFQSAIAPLKQNKTNIVGVILNNRTYSIPGFIYKLT